MLLKLESESGIRIRNPDSGFWNPNPESGIRNPGSGIRIRTAKNLHQNPESESADFLAGLPSLLPLIKSLCIGSYLINRVNPYVYAAVPLSYLVITVLNKDIIVHRGRVSKTLFISTLLTLTVGQSRIYPCSSVAAILKINTKRRTEIPLLYSTCTASVLLLLLN